MTTPALNDDLVQSAERVEQWLDGGASSWGVPVQAIRELIKSARSETLAADNAALRSALSEAEDTLALVERPSFPDPRHHDEVKRLGQRIGFGALMSTASAGWREVLADRPGGEFVAGPCHSTVVNTLRIIRTTLTGAS